MVEELLGFPATTLGNGDSVLRKIMQKESRPIRRYYRPEDLRVLRMIHYLVKVKGLRMDAAKEELRSNRSNVSRRMEIIDLLTDTRQRLEEMLSALNKRR